MTSGAGVRHAKFFCEQGIGDGEPMIVTAVSLHVGRLRHMATDAIIAFLIRLMMTVSDRIDLRRRQDRCAVTSEAKRVSLQNRLAGMWIMAVDAPDAVIVHFAAEE